MQKKAEKEKCFERPCSFFFDLLSFLFRNRVYFFPNQIGSNQINQSLFRTRSMQKQLENLKPQKK